MQQTVKPSHKSYKLLGVQVNALTISDLNALVHEAVKHGEKSIIANHNLHSLYLFHHDPSMQRFYDAATYTHIDGMPIVFLGKILGFPFERMQRVTYADWIWPLIEESHRNDWRVFYLGSKPGIAETGAELLRDKYPGLDIKTSHGYFDISPNSSENRAILEEIKAFKPNILMVGMGMPRQERWIIENLNQIEANSILTSGACIDYVAGAVPTPPRILGKLSLEWLYRFFVEPKRLWKRYFIEPWFVLYLFFKDLFSRRKIIQ